MATNPFAPSTLQRTRVPEAVGVSSKRASFVPAKGSKNSSFTRTSSAGLLSTMVRRPAPTSALPLQR